MRHIPWKNQKINVWDHRPRINMEVQCNNIESFSAQINKWQIWWDAMVAFIVIVMLSFLRSHSRLANYTLSCIFNMIRCSTRHKLQAKKTLKYLLLGTRKRDWCSMYDGQTHDQLSKSRQIREIIDRYRMQTSLFCMGIELAMAEKTWQTVHVSTQTNMTIKWRYGNKVLVHNCCTCILISILVSHLRSSGLRPWMRCFACVKYMYKA